MRGGPVYIVKPKYIFKHPFNKYDLANPTNRETQNEELTDYFNYGFNEDTMNTYGKLVKRFIEVLDHHKNLEYFNEPSELMRLNDEMPMDFGGFCKFHDPSIIDNDTPEDFHTGQPLVKYFIMMIFANASRKIEYPLIEFIKHMYKKQGEEEGQDTALYDIIEQIGKNLDQKYQETMKKLIDKQNQAKNPPQKKGKDDRRDFHRDGDRNPKDRERERERQRERQREKEKEREREKEKEREAEKALKEKQQKKQKEKKSKSQSSSDSDSDSDESNQTDGKKKKREGKERSEDRSKKHKKKEDKDRKKKDKEKDKDKKQKHKTKKVKKEKSHKRSKSRDRKKKHH